MKFLKSFGFLCAACLLAVVGGDWLLFGWPLGCNLALAISAALLLIALRNGPAFMTRTTFVLVLALGGLTLAMCEQPTVVGTLLAVVGLITYALAARGGFATSLAGWLRRWGRLPDHILLRPLRDTLIAGKWFYRHPSSEPAPLRWTVLWTLPLALGLVFVIIFAVANPIIAQWAHALWSNFLAFLETLPTWLSFGRISFWILSGLGTYGLLRARRRTRRPASAIVPPRLPGVDVKPMLIVRCLLVFNLIFSVQTFLDALYLCGGAALPRGLTYADYAHRGSYALIVAALLAAAFVLITFRPAGTAERFTWARRLVYLWIAQNVLLTLAAVWRLKLYVSVYSLTRFRVAAAIWMLIVAAGLALIVWRIVRRRNNTWLLHANALTVAAVLYLCAFCNFNGGIAWFNVTHCHEADGQNANLDAAYLRDLGPEALPAVCWALENFQDAGTQKNLQAVQTALEAALARDLANWRGWTWRRQRLSAGLQERAAALRPRPL